MDRIKNQAILFKHVSLLQNSESGHDIGVAKVMICRLWTDLHWLAMGLPLGHPIIEPSALPAVVSYPGTSRRVNRPTL